MKIIAKKRKYFERLKTKYQSINKKLRKILLFENSDGKKGRVTEELLRATETGVAA